MAGVSLYRWTMAYVGAALMALLTALAMMVAGRGYPEAALAAPDTLALVHLVTIGWLSLLMCGALLQFVPVLVAKPLRAGGLSLPALLILVAGLAHLELGFLALGGRVAPVWPFFQIGGGLLTLGFGLVTWTLVATLRAARPLTGAARFLPAGLAALAGTVLLGLCFALTHAGVHAAGAPAGVNEFVSTLLARGVPIHAALGLGGWLTFTAMGVSYRLLAMFMLAPETERASTRLVLGLGVTALALAFFGGLAAVIAGVPLSGILLAAALAGTAALGLYGADVRHLYRARNRRRIELNTRMAVPAFASLAGSILCAGLLHAAGRLEDHVGAVVFLVGFGWLSGLALSMLYKIVAFLTWLECYGPVMGRVPTPRVQDLVVEKRAQIWFVTYFVGVWGAFATLLASSPLAFRGFAAVILVATMGLVVELVRIRRLRDVPGAQDLPAGAHRPLLLCAAKQVA